MTHRLPTLAALATLALSLAACGGEQKGQGAAADGAAPSSTADAGGAGGAATPDPGGKIVEVEMLTDDEGNNVFRPADCEAATGDVIRYKLVSGVHNAHFLADSNPGKPNLPPATDMLQAPGQTVDVKVTMAPGRYYYHCDPHALLGMVGHVTVK